MSSNKRIEYLQRISDHEAAILLSESPIKGFGSVPLVSLKEALYPLHNIVPEILETYEDVYENSPETDELLSKEEYAAIKLYTNNGDSTENSFYYALNTNLRLGKHDLLKPWFLYLKLVITALEKLPSLSINLYRGMKRALSNEYPKGTRFTWWAFSSCTKSIEVLEQESFFGKKNSRTIFSIECFSGKSISKYSVYPNEDEILLLPGSHFEVYGNIDMGGDMTMVQIRQLPALLSPSVISTESKIYVNKELERFLTENDSDELDLMGRTIQHDDIGLVFQFGIHAKNIAKLDLGSTGIDNKAAIALADRIRNNKSIRVLNLSSNRITDEGIKSLAIAINYSGLVRIDLSRNEFKCAGVAHLASMLERNEVLEELLLASNKIENQGIINIAEAISNPKSVLKILDLSGNRNIKESGIDALIFMLKENQSLKRLCLRSCGIPMNARSLFDKVKSSKRRIDIWF